MRPMIDDTFQKLKSNLELTPSFADIVSQRHNAVRRVIENNLVNATTKLIGSLSRQTRIQPRAGDDIDIDILVVLGEFAHWVKSDGITTGVAMTNVHRAIQTAERYAKMNPEQDHPTVTFDYANSVTVEMVPAYLDKVGKSFDGTPHQPAGRAYWVPGRDGIWELSDYDYEADYISALNKGTNGLFVPTVKMLKAAKRWHFPAMKSYHLEVIAAHLVPVMLEEYRQTSTPPTFPLLVGDALFRLGSQLATRWGIPGSLSKPFTIDGYTRVTIDPKVKWLGEQARLAYHAKTDGEKHQIWRTIFGEVLPLS
jgi:hypothetical protein